MCLSLWQFVVLGIKVVCMNKLANDYLKQMVCGWQMVGFYEIECFYVYGNLLYLEYCGMYEQFSKVWH